MILQQTAALSFTPKRIISLVPSQTELLFHLGLHRETIGITKFCVHPQSWFKNKSRVGGTKTVNFKKIQELKPDLIIANKEENVQQQIEALAEDYPVWLTDVNSLAGSLQMIADIGMLTGKTTQANKLVTHISDAFNGLQKNTAMPDTAYLIWRNPYMAAGNGTFIDDMMRRCGFKNVFAGLPRYPEVDIAALQASNCRLLLLSSEPYPFKQKHIDELSSLLPGTRILLVDGEMFSWYGSRLLQSPAYFQQLITEMNSD